jgi:hypothetical protein
VSCCKMMLPDGEREGDRSLGQRGGIRTNREKEVQFLSLKTHSICIASRPISVHGIVV